MEAGSGAQVAESPIERTMRELVRSGEYGLHELEITTPVSSSAYGTPTGGEVVQLILSQLLRVTESGSRRLLQNVVWLQVGQVAQVRYCGPDAQKALAAFKVASHQMQPVFGSDTEFLERVDALQVEAEKLVRPADEEPVYGAVNACGRG